jgi:hypothetical protein
MPGVNNNIQLTGLDFDEIKSNFKTFLREQNVLKDANYEGSALSILLDILAYNTHYNAHYLNMVANEMFLDTAVKRSSVISHAKVLGYLPGSITAPTATVNVYFEGVTSSQIVLPRHTKFITETIDNTNYPYVTLEEIVITRDQYNNTANAINLQIKQGEPLTYSFLYNVKQNPKAIFRIPESNIDLSTLRVIIQKSTIDINNTIYNYPDDILALDGDSEVYFIQETFDGYYELYFGDGVIGKKLQDGNIVIINYLAVSETIIQNVSEFTLVSDSIGNYGDVIVTTTIPGNGGKGKETLETIKYMAPKAYAAQERAVTVNDYITLIQKNSGQFPIDSVNVWAGDKNDPPIYGKVFVAVKPRGGYSLTLAQKNKLRNNIIKPISVLTADPVIVDADYIYVKINADVLYNPAKAMISYEELRSYIKYVISQQSKITLNTFNSTLVLPDIINVVRNANPSIITNECKITLQKRILPDLNRSENYYVKFGTKIKRDILRKSVSISPSIKSIDNSIGALILRSEVFFEEVPSSASSIQSIKIIGAGLNYTSTPTIIISGDGSGAKAHAIVKSGKISDIVVDNPGSGYTQATVEISGGGGILASAQPILDSQFGYLRTYYFNNGLKIILNSSAGTVDYENGIVTLTNFKPQAINNELQQLSINVVPDNTILSSNMDRILTLDDTDPDAITVNLTAK